MAKKQSDAEIRMSRALRSQGLRGYRRELKFHPERKWRFDFAWPKHRIALEVEGGVYSRGRHLTPKGFIADCEKYNAAARMGWRVFRIPVAGKTWDYDAARWLAIVIKQEEER